MPIPSVANGAPAVNPIPVPNLQGNENVQPNGPLGNPVPQGNPVQPAIQPDPALADAAFNGAGPDLQPGGGQAGNFAANHDVGAGRDWDMHSAEGMLETVRNSVAHLKTQVAGEKQINAFIDNVVETTARMIAGRQEADAAVIAADLAALKETAAALKNARAGLLAGISEGGAKDPREAIANLRTTLRVFRFETQKALGARGNDAGRMGVLEGSLRKIQNFFTFGVKHRVTEADLAEISRLETELAARLADLRGHLAAIDPGAIPERLPAAAQFGNTIGDALELSHRTNDQIRDFQDADETGSTLRGIVGPLVEKGGSRKVEFSAGVGALIGLGMSKAATVGLRLGGRVKLTGEINAPGKGRPISVTFRFTGGAEGKLAAAAGKESEIAGAKGQVTGGAEASYFTTRTYATLDDLVLDAGNCGLSTSRATGGAILGGLKSALSHSIGKLGTKFFRWLGRRSGEVKQDNAAYLRSLKQRDIVGGLDGLLAKRANPVIVGRRYGGTFAFRGEAKGSINIGEGIATLGSGLSYSHEHDFMVTSRAFAPLARVARGVSGAADLDALMRAGPDGGLPGPIPHYNAANPAAIARMLENRYDEAILHAEEADRRSKGVFVRTDVVGFARAANEIRTLILATELAVREGKISRAMGNRLLERFSNPPVKFPQEVFAEYLMDGAGAAKPAKIRNTVTFSFKAGLFTGATDDLTKGIDNSIVKSLAEGGVSEMRHQSGLDTTVQYRFSSEKPVKADDPRPWENVPRTVHELSVTASTPARVFIDAITKTYANKGGRLEYRSPNIAKDIAVGLAKDIAGDTAMGALYATLPGLLMASVKETAVKAVEKWLSDPANVEKLIRFAIEHADDALGLLVDIVEWIAENPDETLYIARAIQSASSLGESERNKVIQWSFIDGEFESVTVLSQKNNKIGANVDPVGAGVTVGFDFSYSVAESVKDREYGPTRPILSFLAKAEEFLASEPGFGPAGRGEAFKNWLAHHFKGVEHMLAGLFEDDDAKAKSARLYLDAQAAAHGDLALQQRLQDAWHAVQDLPADATPDRKIDVAHEFLVCLVMAYAANPAE